MDYNYLGKIATVIYVKRYQKKKRLNTQVKNRFVFMRNSLNIFTMNIILPWLKDYNLIQIIKK